MEELLYQGSWERIDSRLTTQFSYSRNFFQHIISSWRLQVKSSQRDWFVPKKSYSLQQWDLVRVENLERFLDGWILDECPSLEISTDRQLTTQGDVYKSLHPAFLIILQETIDYLVIYKPKGVLSHPSSIRDVNQPSVVGGLYHYFQQAGLPSMGSFIRAGLIHRLDKDTDGLMIIAKSETWLTHFKRLFQQKSASETIAEKEAVLLKKFYRATCRLTLLGESFWETIVKNLPRYIDELVVAKLPHAKEPKRWITKILAIESSLQNDACVEVDVEILTWRTHQIRYHLSNHGLPIVGDYLYGVGDEEESMQLTAWKLVFEDLEWIMQTIEI